jgi:hypothetical protein
MIRYLISINVSYNEASFLGMTYAFLWSPFIPYPKSILPTAFAATRATNAYNEQYNS